MTPLSVSRTGHEQRPVLLANDSVLYGEHSPVVAGVLVHGSLGVLDEIVTYPVDAPPSCQCPEAMYVRYKGFPKKECDSVAMEWCVTTVKWGMDGC